MLVVRSVLLTGFAAARLLALVLLVACTGFVLPAAGHAAGSPNISVGLSIPAQTLFGSDTAVSVTAQNPAGQPYGYNLSFRAVLPTGTNYVAGSAGAATGDPKVIANQPAAGQTTLIWSNLADLSPNSGHAISFSVRHSTATRAAGDTLAIAAEAYIASDARYVPKFSTVTGQPDGGGPTSYTGSATTSGSTVLTPIELTKSEPSPEGELLRGVHDHQTIYTLVVKNNSVNPTTALTIDDYLPAGLEYLGCAAVADHTTDAPTNPGATEEYPGSGPITVGAVPSCLTPALVKTESVDPDGAGSLPLGTYTHVRWTGLGNLAAAGTLTLKYRAAIPLRKNTLTWTTAGGPPADTGLQAANLDNNAGAEVTDEEPLRNYAAVQGTYLAGTVSDSDDITRSGEDLAVQKSVDSGALNQGQLNTWTLKVEASEYRYVDDVVVTDTVPDGQCPLGAANFSQAPQSTDDTECDPGGGAAGLPSHAYSSVTENSDGTYAVVFDSSNNAALARLARNGTVTVTFPTRTRTHYQEAFAATGPILAADTVSNHVDLAGNAKVICSAPIGDCTSGTPIAHDGIGTEAVVDESAATQTAIAPTLTKQVAANSASCDPATASYGKTSPAYRPGDRICWLVRVDFPSNLDTHNLTLTDYLPNTLAFEPGAALSGAQLLAGTGQTATTADTLPGSTFTDDTAGLPGGTLRWSLPSSGMVHDANVFEHVIATRAGRQGISQPGDLPGNLFKTSVANTAGISVPLRDEANFTPSEPVLAVAKRIMSVNGTLTSGTAGVASKTVNGGDAVAYRVRTTNTGTTTAENMEVWDRLPGGITCAMVAVGTINSSGTCDGADNTIKWGPPTLLSVPVGTPLDLTYTLNVPTTLQPTQPLTNTAGVRQYTTPINTGGNFTYTPLSNIDPSILDAGANVPAVKATAVITGAALTITKSHTTSLTPASGGNTAQTATIGETIIYTVTATLPKGETVNALKLTDPSIPDVRQPYVAGSATATLNGVALPTAGFTLDQSTGTPIVNVPASYTASTGANDVIVLTFQTTVAQTAANVFTGTLTNQARLTYTPPAGGGTSPVNSTANNTTLVEPRLALSKTNDHPLAVKGDDLVNYTLSLSNTGTSPAYDTTLVDVLPSGVTPVDSGGAAIADGATVAGATWDLTARTLTFAPSATILDGAAAASFTYRVRVNDPAVGGSALTNTVVANTTSLPGTVAGERTSGNDPAGTATTRYRKTATNTLTVDKASVTKAASPGTATIGSPVTYTVNVTIPAQVELYDATVIDTLPDSIDFDAHTSATCTSGCPPSLTTQNYTPVVNGNGTTTVAWDLGDLASVATPRVVALVYHGHVRATHRNGGAAVLGGQTSVNTAKVSSNTTDRVGPFTPGTIPAGAFDNTSADATATVAITEPAVTLDKRLAAGSGTLVNGPVDVQVGQTLSYRLRVMNTGTAPLHDVTVNDLPDAELTGVTLAAGISTTANTDGWTAASPALQWLIPGPIAAGASVDLEYTASLVPVAGLSNGQQIDNTATLPTSYGLPQTDRDANPTWSFRSYAAPNDSVQAVVRLPVLAIVKTPDAGSAVAGDPVSFSIVVSNTAPAGVAATGVVVTDTLPAGVTYAAGGASAAPSAGFTETSATAGSVAWTIASLAGGSSVTITVPVQTDPAAADATLLTNSATTSAIENPAPKTDSGSVSLTRSADLAASKTASPSPATAGEALTYTLGAHNDGPSTAVNVHLNDPLPTGVTFVSASAGCTLTGTTVDCAAGTVLPGDDATATIEVTVDAGVTATISNTVTVSTDTPDPTPANDTATALVPVGAVADLSLTKVALQSTVVNGQTASFRLTTHNAGPSTAVSVSLVDTLPAGLTYVSDDRGCTLAGATLTCALGTIAPGDDEVVEVLVRGVAVGAQLNTASVDGVPADTTPLDNTDTATITVLPAADLALTKTAASMVDAGGTLTYTLEVINHGPDAATNPAISDPLPAGTSLVSADPGCALTAAIVRCTQAMLANGDTATFQLTVRVPVALGTQTILNTATASADEDDPTPADNTDAATTTVGPAVDLEVVKTAPGTVSAGGTLTWTLVVRNLGPSTAQAVTLTDPLPGGVAFMAATATQGRCSAPAGIVGCDLGDLLAGATAQLVITATVPEALATSTVTNTASVTATEPDADPASNRSTAKTTIDALPVRTAAISIVKTADGPATFGRALGYTLTVTNAGPADAPDTVVTDALAGTVRFQSAGSDHGPCAEAGGTVTCRLGTVANGQTVTAHVTVIPLKPGALVNNATVASSASGGVLSAQVSSAPVRVRINPTRLKLEKRASAAHAKPGQRLSYRLKVTNLGTTTAVDVRVCDRLPRTLSLRSVRGGTLKDSQLCFAIDRLKRGASQVFTVKVRVNAVVGATVIRNRATAAASNAKTVAARTSTPLSAVAGTRVRGVTG